MNKKECQKHGHDIQGQLMTETITAADPIFLD